MFKKILTIAAVAVAILMAGCTIHQKSTGETEEGNKNNTEKSENEKPADVSTDGENENVKDEIDLSLKPNELGEIMILMYHGIGEEESDWQRTPENFRKDLENLYQQGYRFIGLNDFAEGEVDTKEGFTPIIMTFDDGRKNNFNIVEENGNTNIDPNCAVGILEEFKKKYPDFNVTATFYLGTNLFGQEEYKEYKLKWLIDNGYEIGNHTYSHKKMSSMNGEEIQAEIGSVNSIINKYLPEYVVDTLSMPLGSNPGEEYAKYALEGTYQGKEYKNIAVLDVGWRPSYSPFDKRTDFSNLYRVTASETNVGGCGIYDYLKQFEENKRVRFISDGRPDIVTVPKTYEENINPDMLGEKKLNIYN
jgi:peptidoglycan/xylan/chitin deacetylase (PgdA/CDA1 family)